MEAAARRRARGGVTARGLRRSGRTRRSRPLAHRDGGAAGQARGASGALRASILRSPARRSSRPNRCWPRSGCAGGPTPWRRSSPARRRAGTRSWRRWPMPSRAATFRRNLFDGMIAARLFDAGDAPFEDLDALARLCGRHLRQPYGTGRPSSRRLRRGDPRRAPLRARGRDRGPAPSAAGTQGAGARAAAAGRGRRGARSRGSGGDRGGAGGARRRCRARPPPLCCPAGSRTSVSAAPAADPEAVMAGGLELSEFRSRAALLRRAATGRW